MNRSATSPSPSAATGTRRPSRLVAGALLILIGVVLVAGRLIPGAGDTMILVIALGCLVAFALTREYGYAIAAGITGGVGTGVALLVSGRLAESDGGAVFLGCVAAGFVAAWLLGLLARPRETNPWPLIPAAVFAAVAGTVVTGSADLLNAVLAIGVVALILAGIRLVWTERRGSVA